MSWLGGRIELADTVVEGSGTEGLGTAGPMGLDIGGLWEIVPNGGLGTAFAMFMGILLVGKDGGIALDEEEGMPSLAAMICARSW